MEQLERLVRDSAVHLIIGMSCENHADVCTSGESRVSLLRLSLEHRTALSPSMVTLAWKYFPPLPVWLLAEPVALVCDLSMTDHLVFSGGQVLFVPIDMRRRW